MQTFNGLNVGDPVRNRQWPEQTGGVAVVVTDTQIEVQLSNGASIVAPAQSWAIDRSANKGEAA